MEDVLRNTTFEGSPMIAVSAYTGQGLDELRGLIDSRLDTIEVRTDLGRPRLPVDRCFTVAGFGTVVTGTLIDGTLSVGQEVELAISGKRRGSGVFKPTGRRPNKLSPEYVWR